MPAPVATEEEKAGEHAALALPEVATRAGRSEILARLAMASRRGRLPGFESESGSLFAVAAHGQPFDARLIGDYRAGAEGEPARVVFRLRVVRRMPVIFAVILALTVWPGAYFMDELVAQFAPGLWRPWVTYYWYLPLTILPIPWIWRSLMRRTRATTEESAAGAIEKIALEIGGTVVRGDHATPR